MYKVTIGLEVHCEITSNTKNFSWAKNTYDSEVNIHVATTDLGLPGILPVANKEATRKAIKTAYALNCEIPDIVTFDRKNYYYPDLPKGYQITQMNKPYGINGYLMINVNGEDKKVLIHDLHLEEDTASLEHFNTYSLINYNRSGIPLMEIVTEPCLHSTEEALTFLEALRSVFLYCEVSEAKSDKGQMRCDVNISLSKDENLGTRVEMKNINSFNNVKLAIECEVKRQTEILESGGIVLQETRRYSDSDDCTYAMRSKEDAIDYKYFVEPNIPPIKLDQKWLEEIKDEIPLLQYERINKYMSEYDLSRYDATVLVKEKSVADYFEETINCGAEAKLASNWITSIILSYLNKQETTIDKIYVQPKMLKEMIDLLNEGTISSKQAKEVLYKALEENKEPTKIVKESGIKQIGTEDEILKIVLEVLDENPGPIEEYKKGRINVVDWMVGQVMKKTRGQANPTSTMNLMKQEIEKR